MNDHRHSKAIAYLRVSTDRQGKSGLGLEAQRDAVARYLASNGLELIAEHVEVETGKGSNALARRPELVAALAAAKKQRAVLIVAKLDRLARNTRFLLTLIDSGADVAFADMPQVSGPMGRFIVTQMAAVAELEAGLISQRTKAALAAAKERGQVLGKHGKVQAARNKAEAVERLEPVLPVLRELKGEGMTMRQMVTALNDREIASPAGGKWHLANLHKAMTRMSN
ncbi:MAG: resolvase [Alphaproteobacteria bacterium HGW-Alphaproteobacteria-17]|nr:MAG: resolvase [Alphaproteobacteria bacterium HGW-Alphaproteobacteria-17]